MPSKLRGCRSSGDGAGDRIQLTGVGTARHHRTRDEGIFVRFPALARRLLYLWSRLPKESRLRRQLLVRLVGQGMSAANRRDFDVLLLGLDPEIDYRAVSAGPGGGVAPDLVGHHHGHAGYRYVWRALLDGLEDLTLEPEELLDLGDHVISVTRLSGHGSGRGVPINQLLFQVFTFRRGLVVKQEDFGSREEALEAVGLRE
jgi:ketosteroid isomerase-like protein